MHSLQVYGPLLKQNITHSECLSGKNILSFYRLLQKTLPFANKTSKAAINCYYISVKIFTHRRYKAVETVDKR